MQMSDVMESGMPAELIEKLDKAVSKVIGLSLEPTMLQQLGN